MDLKYLKQLAALMREADLTELEVEEKGGTVRMCRGPKETPIYPMAPVTALAGAAPPGVEPGGTAPARVEGEAAGGNIILKSPMVGTFYRAPAPDADLFVEVGSEVNAETVVCIVEAMKVMNEIKAEVHGEIVAVLAENGTPVQFGQPLFEVRPV